VTTLSAQILRLDNILRRYGPDTYPAREILRQYAEQKTADLFPDEGADVRLDNPSTYELLQRLEDSMLELKHSNPRDQWWLDQAMTLASKIGDTRWLLVQQLGQGRLIGPVRTHFAERLITASCLNPALSGRLP
jgi:hypothetical protein